MLQRARELKTGKSSTKLPHIHHRNVKNPVWVNYLLVEIFSVHTAELVSRAVLSTAAAGLTATRASAAAAYRAMLLPKLPHLIFLTFISGLLTLSRGISRRWTGKWGCIGLFPEVCNCSLYFTVNPLLMTMCFICNLQKQFKELWTAYIQHAL